MCILSILLSDTLGRADISHRLGQKKISGQLNAILSELMSAGKIERTNPGKSNSRLQKYRITEKGREAFKGSGK